MPPPSQAAGLAITNPLVLYRGLVATKKIKPDPAQHRLALQLQKLYYRLKDYDPEIEYRQRIDQISRTIGRKPTRKVEDGQPPPAPPPKSFLSSLWGREGSQATGPIMSLTRTVPIHESAMTIDSPQGMLLYGEVGRGKSMLLDLLSDCLPNSRKSRWHFNAFMLDTFRRLEQLRKERLDLPTPMSGMEQEHSVLTLARDMVTTSPILFLDEFQLPDRTASKLLASFMTSFFHLGGVLIATSNRMPEELAKAAGVEYMPEPRSRFDNFSRLLSFGRNRGPAEVAASTDFGAFLEVLKARCETWEMEGERDWRREYMPVGAATPEANDEDVLDELDNMSTTSQVSSKLEGSLDEAREDTTPTHYHLTTASVSPEVSADSEATWAKATGLTVSPESALISETTSGIDWQPSILRVYGRQVPVPAQSEGVSRWDFNTLCGSTLGPADYISLASTYHTIILENVPILTSVLKNEARRFITLLDALYEARCRLLVRAAAPPDHLFFPETKSTSTPSPTDRTGDEVYQETLAEIYQDTTAPFRPNVSSSYTPSTSEPTYPRHSILADEDADFGPVYGSGRGHGASAGADGLTTTEKRQASAAERGPDFTRTALLTGEDERFAYKRARSRLWEMCGDRWWNDRPLSEVEGWWKPMKRSLRQWEGSSEAELANAVATDAIVEDLKDVAAANEKVAGEATTIPHQDSLFRHGASPFRTRADPPPKFSWVHAWGMMQWGKKAGEWGKGVDAKVDEKSRKDGGGDDGKDK